MISNGIPDSPSCSTGVIDISWNTPKIALMVIPLVADGSICTADTERQKIRDSTQDMIIDKERLLMSYPFHRNTHRADVSCICRKIFEKNSYKIQIECNTPSHLVVFGVNIETGKDIS